LFTIAKRKQQRIFYPTAFLLHEKLYENIFLHLPPPRDTSVLSRLRTATSLPRLTSRTNNITPLLYWH